MSIKYFVLGLSITSRSIDLEKFSVDMRYSISSNRVLKIDVLLDKREIVDLTLMMYDSQFNVYNLKLGTRIVLKNPLILGRVCLGNTSISMIRRGDIVYVYRYRELCNRTTHKCMFCLQHTGSDYADYLRFVFGRSKYTESSLVKILHMIYVMHTGTSNIKVGIANGLKNTLRIFEQPFILATIVAFLENGVKARKLELELSRSRGLSDRVPLHHRITRIKALYRKLDVVVKDFAYAIKHFVDPVITKFGINTKSIIPMITLDRRYYEYLDKAKIISDESTHIEEGTYEIIDYGPGGIVLANTSNNQYMYIPYDLIRDRVINISATE